MMKSRFRATLLPLFTAGEYGLNPLTKSSTLLDRCFAARPFASFQLERIESLTRSTHSCAGEEDDFSELGLPVEQSVGTFPMLMTEKPETFKRSISTKKPSSLPPESIEKLTGTASKQNNCASKNSVSTKKASSLPSESIRNLVNTFSKQNNCASTPHLKPENNTDASCSKLAKKNASNFKSSTSVTIENVPSLLHLRRLKEAVSTYGKISNASMRAVPNGLDCCDIEFESVESRNRAVSVGRITLENFNLPILPLHVLHIVSLRISNVSSETDDSLIRSLCMSCGPLEGMVRDKDIVDASFSIRGKSDTEKIQKRLNQTIVDACKWSACLQTVMPTAVVTNNDNNAELHLGLEVSGKIHELKSQISLTQVLAEDLEYLYHALLHLQSHPSTGNKH
ncbi:uncharacterized protein LOC7460442 isoform X11 [Populus trichocarpa]|uniref:uncharacterized protein LOC7460442 isoform X11 n=1 Tax=Populus trichocarpa TaxID=3694 RepID=UPI000D187DD7|nr:uncharacterized protein LOC7460442 isoform X11 [Populus trichocarpa]|eukprot:XP_024450380.1 uncharacterized protein LOC7460442 isoform X10 [Populus trichocarpa]